MTRSWAATVAAWLMVAPISVCAQTSNGPVTRADVTRHLVDIENAGFLPTQASSLRFPFNVEAAEARVAAQDAARSNVRHTAITNEAQDVVPPR